MPGSSVTSRAAVGDPVYLQVAEKLRQYIEQDRLAPGDLVPPEAELAVRFKVSRVTLRRAVEVLAHEGLLVRRQGIGTFVAARRLSVPLVGLHSTRDIGRAHSFRHDVRIVAFGPASASAAEANQLKVPAGLPVLRFTRLDLIDDIPAAVAECTLPYHLVNDITVDDLQRSSTYELIESKRKVFLTSAKQSIRAEGASREIAPLLGVPEGAPVLVLDRITFDAANNAVELGKVSYRHDRMEWTIELTRQFGGEEETQTGMLPRYQPA